MKSYIITGAGSGIGRATAKVLALQENVQLILIGRNQTTLDETLHQLPAHQSPLSMAFDIRDKKKWNEFFSKPETKSLNLCGVFANAGVGGVNEYGATDRWDEIISTNLTGTYNTVMECIPHLKKSSEEFRHVVITSSCLARFGVIGHTAYCTAKTGLLGLTRALALEFAKDKILVNAICPGWVDTSMARHGIQRLAEEDEISFDESLNMQKSFVPLNRISNPEEIGELVSFLFSSKQTSITGQAIDINNGSFMI